MLIGWLMLHNHQGIRALGGTCSLATPSLELMMEWNQPIQTMRTKGKKAKELLDALPRTWVWGRQYQDTFAIAQPPFKKKICFKFV